MDLRSEKPQSFDELFVVKYLIMGPDKFKGKFDQFVVTIFGDIAEIDTKDGKGVRLMLAVSKQDTYQECLDYVKKVMQENNWMQNKEVAEYLRKIVKSEYLKFVMEAD